MESGVARRRGVVLSRCVQQPLERKGHLHDAAQSHRTCSNPGHHFAAPYATNVMPNGWLYNTWLTLSKEIVDDESYAIRVGGRDTRRRMRASVAHSAHNAQLPAAHACTVSGCTLMARECTAYDCIRPWVAATWLAAARGPPPRSRPQRMGAR